jgi:hypothetical protein
MTDGWLLEKTKELSQSARDLMGRYKCDFLTTRGNGSTEKKQAGGAAVID